MYTMMKKKIPHKRFLELHKYKIALKFLCISKILQNCLPKFTLKEKPSSFSAYSYSGIRSIESDLRYLPTTKATYCLAADEESFGSTNKQVSL